MKYEVIKKINNVLFLKAGSEIEPEEWGPLQEAMGVDYIVELPDASYLIEVDEVKKELRKIFDNVVDDFYSLAPKYRTKEQLRGNLRGVLNETE